VASIFSHLAATDNPEHDDFTHTQAARFLKMYAKISTEIGYKPLRHILNTSGISRFKQPYQFDMVRLGIGLYGVDSESEIQSKLENVLTLKATISQVKHIAAGETIGYNRAGKAEKDLRIGTVSIGYADGISRRLSNRRGAFLVEQQLAYIVGNVCMDMCMIDITNIPLAKEGSDVIIFGKNRPVQALAIQAETIAYELFTDVSSRVKRVYFSED
jgi:alanine racemase